MIYELSELFIEREPLTTCDRTTVQSSRQTSCADGCRGSESRRGSSNLVALGENGYIESFNGKLRDELLNGEIFDTVLEARVVTETLRKHYNTIRPHSSLEYRAPAVMDL